MKYTKFFGKYYKNPPNVHPYFTTPDSHFLFQVKLTKIMQRALLLCCTMNIKPRLPPLTQAPLPQNDNRGFTNSPLSDSTSDIESDATLVPDFETLYASERFFFSSPGHSNLITDSVSTNNPASSSRLELMDTVIACRSIAVTTYSADPVEDFQRSMQEMIETRELHGVREDWDYLRELLICYLLLNPKSTHKFIIKAYTQLVVNLMTSTPHEKDNLEYE